MTSEVAQGEMKDVKEGRDRVMSDLKPIIQSWVKEGVKMEEAKAILQGAVNYINHLSNRKEQSDELF